MHKKGAILSVMVKYWVPPCLAMQSIVCLNTSLDVAVKGFGTMTNICKQLTSSEGDYPG
jgi:hypothetical protein